MTKAKSNNGVTSKGYFIVCIFSKKETHKNRTHKEEQRTEFSSSLGSAGHHVFIETLLVRGQNVLINIARLPQSKKGDREKQYKLDSDVDLSHNSTSTYSKSYGIINRRKQSRHSAVRSQLINTACITYLLNLTFVMSRRFTTNSNWFLTF